MSSVRGSLPAQRSEASGSTRKDILGDSRLTCAPRGQQKPEGGLWCDALCREHWMRLESEMISTLKTCGDGWSTSRSRVCIQRKWRQDVKERCALPRCTQHSWQQPRQRGSLSVRPRRGGWRRRAVCVQWDIAPPWEGRRPCPLCQCRCDGPLPSLSAIPP